MTALSETRPQAPTALEAIQIAFESGTGRRLLDDINLTVQPGEVLALVGPNGAGKSTLLSILAGDLHPSQGEVRLLGESVNTIRPHELACKRAVLPQQTILQFAFTAREVVAMGRAPYEASGQWRLHRGRAKDDDDRAVAVAMERTETSPLADRLFPTLSGGEQSRVSLARVLAQQTPILLLDEPTAALDLRHQQLVMEIARDLAGRGAAIVAILHDLNLAASYADRLAILCRGQLRAVDRPWEALDEHLLSDVFDCPIAVMQHPVRGCPLVMPLPSKPEDHPDIPGFDLSLPGNQMDEPARSESWVKGALPAK